MKYKVTGYMKYTIGLFHVATKLHMSDKELEKILGKWPNVPPNADELFRALSGPHGRTVLAVYQARQLRRPVGQDIAL